MARTPRHRRDWGSLYANLSETRKDAKGRPLAIGFIAEYTAPAVNPATGKAWKGKRKFKKGMKAMAEAWLDSEHEYCMRCEKGLEVFKPWKQREEEKKLRAMTLEAWSGLWVEHYRKSDGTRLRGNSMRALRNSVANFVDALGGDRPLTSVTTADVEAMNTRLLEEKGRYAARSTYGKLKACLKEATEVKPWHPRLLESNPCTLPAPKRPKRSAQAKIPEPTPEELKAIYDRMPAYLRIGVYFCATCGGDRVNELCAMRVSDIDLRHRLVHIHRGLDRGPDDRGRLRIVDRTKNEASDAYVPIPEAIIPMFEEHIAKYTDWPEDPDATLLKSASGAECVSPNTFRANFKKAATEAGRPDLHVHTLRATFDTYAVRLNHGGTVRDYMAVTRRTDEATSVNAYQKTDLKRQAELVNRIGDAIINPDSDSKDEAKSREEKLLARIAELEKQLAENNHSGN